MTLLTSSLWTMYDSTRPLTYSNGLITQCRYLPPCSPFLNAVEEAISKMKFYVRQQHSSSRDNFLNSIDEGIRCITGMDCWGWVQHTKQFYDACLDRQVNTVPTSDTSDDNSTDDQHEENEHEE